MRTRKLALFVYLMLPWATYGCGSSDNPAPPADGGTGGTTAQTDGGGGTAKDGSTSNPDVVTHDAGNLDATPQDASDGADGSEPEDNAGLDEEGLKQTLAAVDTPSVNVLPGVKGVVNMFIEDDPTLDLGKTAAENASAMVSRVTWLSGQTCADADIWYNNTTAAITVEFPNCYVNDLAVNGKVKVQVTKDTTGLTVAFVFENLAIHGTTLNGTATVKTANLVDYPMTADLTLSGVSHVKFAGTGEISRPDGSKITGKTNGTGTAEPLGPRDAGTDAGILDKLSHEGWDCTQNDPTAYEITNLARVLGDCYASGGTIKVTKVYACEKKGVLRTRNQTLTSTSLVEWLPTTPSDHKVKMTLSSQLGDASTPGTPVLVTLPWTCPTIPGPELQPEPMPEAGIDAGAEDASGE